MIEAPPPSPDARPEVKEAAPPKTSTMIAAYRAARLNQRLGPPAPPVSAEPQPVPGTMQTNDAAADTLSDIPGCDATETAKGVEAGAATVAILPEETDLSAIGLGPCMLIRLKQIGLHSPRDVALSDPRDLRAALGSSSRMLDVESWIACACRLQAQAEAA